MRSIGKLVIFSFSHKGLSLSLSVRPLFWMPYLNVHSVESLNIWTLFLWFSEYIHSTFFFPLPSILHSRMVYTKKNARVAFSFTSINPARASFKAHGINYSEKENSNWTNWHVRRVWWHFWRRGPTRKVDDVCVALSGGISYHKSPVAVQNKNLPHRTCGTSFHNSRHSMKSSSVTSLHNSILEGAVTLGSFPVRHHRPRAVPSSGWWAPRMGPTWACIPFMADLALPLAATLDGKKRSSGKIQDWRRDKDSSVTKITVRPVHLS